MQFKRKNLKKLMISLAKKKIQFDVFGNKHLVKKINESLKTSTQFRIEKLPLKNRYEFEIYDTVKCDVTWIAINNSIKN